PSAGIAFAAAQAAPPWKAHVSVESTTPTTRRALGPCGARLRTRMRFTRSMIGGRSLPGQASGPLLSGDLPFLEELQVVLALVQSREVSRLASHRLQSLAQLGVDRFPARVESAFRVCDGRLVGDDPRM